MRQKLSSSRNEGGSRPRNIISVHADTPGLDEMLAKFDKEHTHSEDEVRFTVAGRGLFHIHPPDGPVFFSNGRSRRFDQCSCWDATLV